MNVDCAYYFGSKPCYFHKKDKRICDNCTDYKKVENNILIIKLEALGDVLRTTSILPAIKNKYPNCKITWITRTNASLLLKNNPNIQRMLFVESNYLESILNEEFSAGFCLDADSLSATILSLAHCKNKYGFITNKQGQIETANIESNQWYLMGLDDNLKKSNRETYFEIIHKMCCLNNLNEKPQLFLAQTDIDNARNFKKVNNLEGYSKVIGINTGAGKRWECKKWLQKYYIELIKLLKTDHPKLGILLLGGPEEIEFNNEIIQETQNLIIDGGCENSIIEFASLISLTDIFLTSDSLGMHISVALEINTIILVGPTSPWELDVFEKGEVIYNNTLECLACYDSICKNNKECMKTITPDIVKNVIEKYL